MSDRVVVLGGGAAGSSAAILLARAGRSVTLIEQYRKPRHKVCGEFLSVEGCASLAMLGVDLPALGAVPIDRVRLTHGSAVAEAALPFRALSLTRRTLDESLLALAAEAGVEVVRGLRAESVTQDPAAMRGNSTPVWSVPLSDGSSRETRTLVVATGKHDLRGHPRPPARSPKLVAFKQYFRLVPAQQKALGGAVELCLFRGGYAGMQQVEGGLANLCLLLEEHRLRALGGSWVRVLEALCAAQPLLRLRLRGAEPALAHPLALANIPYGFLARPEPTFWRVGDQAAVIPSFTGDGISIALHSARVAAQCARAGGSPADGVRQLRRDLQGSMRRASLLARLLLATSSQPAVLRVAVAWPGILPAMAAVTRIPTAARTELERREQAWNAAYGAYNNRE